MTNFRRATAMGLISLLIFFSGAMLAHATSTLIGLTVYVQEKSNWCWVATSKSIVKYHTSINPSQCTIYKWGKNTSSCSGNLTGTLGTASTIFMEAGMNPGVETPTLSYAAVQDQLGTLYRPILVRWGWNSTGGVSGHMVVLTGYNTSGSKVTYIDPTKSAMVTTTYSAFKSDGVHTWTHTRYGMH